MGLTAAWFLKQANKTVAVVEMDRLACGVSGYTTAKITSGHNLIYSRIASEHGMDKARAYARANEAALESIAGLIEKHSIDCDFERRPNYVYSQDLTQTDKIKQEVDSAQQAGLEVSYVTELDLPYPIAGAIRLENQAQFHPRKYLLALADLVDGDGSFLFEHSMVTDVDEGEPCVVSTDSGRVIARDVVMATHYPFLDRGLFFPRVHPKRSYALVAPIDDGAAPSGMYISTEQPTRSIRSVVDGDRTLLLVGGNGHAVGQRADTEECYDDLEHWARDTFGVTEITHRWSTQDGTTVDMLPYAGTARRTSEHVYTATGFGKWGMTNGTAGAAVISDAILGVQNEFAPLFDPHRVTVGPSAKNFVTENSKIAQHWFGDRVKLPHTGNFEDLEPGDADVRRIGTSLVAGHRDESGELHAVSAICTHLRCVVGWNPAEKSWDCPCHGSRFDTEGCVLQGPAVRNLEKKSIE